MKWPKISIVTPSYNQGEFIEETLDSVLSQGYPDLEYFVVDGGSSDKSVEIIKKYEKHLTWWVSEQDEGQSHAINKGLKRCSGDIVNWINSDDYYEPGALRTVAKAFMENDVDMACFRANVFGLQNRISRGTDIYPENLAKAIAFSRIDQPETFFSRKAFKEMGLLNESLHYCMDKEWLLRYFLLFGNKRVAKCDDIILNFRYHEASKSVSEQEKFQVESDEIFLSLAQNTEDTEAIDALSILLAKNQISSIDSLPKGRQDIQTVHKALNYYLFKRFIEKYESLEFDLCKRVYPFIDLRLLEDDDAAFLNKLQWRAKNIPPSIIRLGRISRR